MNDPAGRSSRRVFLKRSGTVLAVLPLVNLVACSDEGATPAEDATQRERAPGDRPSAGQAPSPPADDATPRTGAGTPAPGGQLTKLEEGDSMAQALGYRHAADEVDAAAYPRFQPGQTCANCSLYQAAQSSEAGWGGCTIFPGKLVSAEGWCNAYVPG